MAEYIADPSLMYDTPSTKTTPTASKSTPSSNKSTPSTNSSQSKSTSSKSSRSRVQSSPSPSIASGSDDDTASDSDDVSIPSIRRYLNGLILAQGSPINEVVRSSSEFWQTPSHLTSTPDEQLKQDWEFAKLMQDGEGSDDQSWIPDHAALARKLAERREARREQQRQKDAAGPSRAGKEASQRRASVSDIPTVLATYPLT